MILRVEHIGIAVKDASAAGTLFEKLLGAPAYKSEQVESEQVTTSFFMAGNTKIELLETDAPGSAIAKFIEKRGEGIHHIAFEVDDIEEESQRLKDAGFELIHTTPKDGADNKRIVFLHPKSTNGVLVELCEEKKTK
jgi:methylmalonyl-CoA/ethylmalonyl-CoA epimerase